MTRREKILAALVGVLGVIFVVFYLGGGAISSITNRQNAIINAEKKLKEAEDELKFRQIQEVDLSDWARGMSLPSDFDSARAAYDDWLWSLAKHVDEDARYTITPPLTTKPFKAPNGSMSYGVLTYSVLCDANLEQLSELLFEFYSTNILHRIAKLDVSPVPSVRNDDAYTDKLSVAITIEAISLSNAHESEFETQVTPGYFSRQTFENEVLAAIVDRNLFEHNFPPEVPELRGRTVGEYDSRLEFTVRANDPEDRDLYFELGENAPRGMRINARGEVSWTPGDREEDYSIEGIEVYVTDVGLPARTVSTTFDVEVIKAAPRPEAPGPALIDPTTRALLAGIIQNDITGPMALINHQVAGEILEAGVDDSFDVGGINFIILNIDTSLRRVTLTADGEERTLDMGDNLAGIATPTRTDIRSRGRGGIGGGRGLGRGFNLGGGRDGGGGNNSNNSGRDNGDSRNNDDDDDNGGGRNRGRGGGGRGRGRGRRGGE